MKPSEQLKAAAPTPMSVATATKNFWLAVELELLENIDDARDELHAIDADELAQSLGALGLQVVDLERAAASVKQYRALSQNVIDVPAAEAAENAARIAMEQAYAARPAAERAAYDRYCAASEAHTAAKKATAEATAAAKRLADLRASLRECPAALLGATR